MKYRNVIQSYGDSAGSKGLILKLKPGEFEKYKGHPVPDCQVFEYDAPDDNGALRWLEKNFNPQDRRPLMGRAYVRSGRPKFRARLTRAEKEELAKTGAKPEVVKKSEVKHHLPPPVVGLPPVLTEGGRVEFAVPSTILADAEYEIKWMNIPVIFFRDRREKKRDK